MKHKTKIISAMLLCSLTQATFADSGFFNLPYLGVEAVQSNQQYKQGYGKYVFHRNPQFYSGFFGFKFFQAVGLEGGYEMQPKFGKNETLGAGQYLPGRGVIVLPITSIQTNSHITGYHPYTLLFVEADQSLVPHGKLKLQGMLGFSYSHIKAQDIVKTINGVTVNTVNNYSKYKFIPMAKIVATHSLSKNFGARLSFNYHNFARFKIKASDNNAGEIRLKDTFGLGIGLTYSFS